MSNPSKFRVNLHVSHPKLSADEVLAPFVALQTRYARSVGARRITKHGEDLGGAYSQTDVSFAVSDRLLDNDQTLVAEFIAQAIDALPLGAIDRFAASGGTCFFFVGIYSDGNILCDFDSRLLARLAEHGIGLKLDFYGGPDE